MVFIKMCSELGYDGEECASGGYPRQGIPGLSR